MKHIKNIRSHTLTGLHGFQCRNATETKKNSLHKILNGEEGTNLMNTLRCIPLLNDINLYTDDRRTANNNNIKYGTNNNSHIVSQQILLRFFFLFSFYSLDNTLEPSTSTSTTTEEIRRRRESRGRKQSFCSFVCHCLWNGSYFSFGRFDFIWSSIVHLCFLLATRHFNTLLENCKMSECIMSMSTNDQQYSAP